MLKNPLLKQAQTKIESGVQDRDAYNRIVQAGTKVIYDKATFTELSKAACRAPDLPFLPLSSLRFTKAPSVRNGPRSLISLTI